MDHGYIYIIVLILIVLIAMVVKHLMERSSPSIICGGGDGDNMSYNSLDDALHEYAHNLSPMKITHLLDLDNYEPLSTKGGGMIAEPKKPWDEYATWTELETDEGALNAYFIQRKTVLNKPNLDWGPVLAEIDPKLQENREYIGIVNVMADGKTLRLVAYEGSPSTSDDEKSSNAFASVPGELVAKYASRPGLFLFHTHPADIRGSPLPSSQDIATAIYFGAASRFAANVVISRYGVLMYGLDWSAYKAINESKNQHLATLNLSYDIIMAHESIRSWFHYTLKDYFDFYPRYGLIMIIYPSSELICHMRNMIYRRRLESPNDNNLIMQYSKEITDYIESNKKSKLKKTKILKKTVNTYNKISNDFITKKFD